MSIQNQCFATTIQSCKLKHYLIFHIKSTACKLHNYSRNEITIKAARKGTKKLNLFILDIKQHQQQHHPRNNKNYSLLNGENDDLRL
jgi:hypothetical protein